MKKTWLVVLVAMTLGIGAGVGAAVMKVRLSSSPGDPAGARLPDNDPRRPLPPGTGEPQSKVSVDQAEYDFGSMDSQASGSHDFIFTNSGDGPLTLTEGDSSCKCTVLGLEKPQVPPGESITVTLEWKAKGFDGPFNQSATIFTNDPRQPKVTLTISGRITKAVRAMPAELVFSRLSVDESATGEIRLLGYLDEALEITGCKVDDPEHFDVAFQPLAAEEVEEQKDATCGKLVKVTVKSGLPLGGFQETIRLKTNLKETPTVEIPVKGTIESEISIIGPGWNKDTGVLTLGTVPSSEGAQRKVLIFVRGPHSQEVRFECNDPEPGLLKVELGETTSLGSSNVTQTPLIVQIPKGSSSANHMGSEQGELGQINIRTTHPKVPRMRVLVRFVVEE